MTTTGERRAANGRRARVALVWGLAAFAGLQLGLAVAIPRWLPELRDPFYGYKAARLRERLAVDPRPFTVVMLGSSRTIYGLRAGLLEERLTAALGRPTVVFNFGIFGAGPVTELLTLRRLLAEGLRPDLLLVEVLPALLGTYAGAPLEAHWLPATRLWLREVPVVKRYGFPARELKHAWWQAWPVPWYAHRFAIVSRWFPAWLPSQLRQDWGRGDDPSGWATAARPPRTPEQYQAGVERARQEYHDHLQTFALGGPSCLALHELLALCRQEGIPSALVLMPEGSEFRSWYPPAVWAQIAGFVEMLRQEHGSTVINAREWVPDHAFADTHHLVLEGATLFTERLGREGLPRLLPVSTTSARMVSRRRSEEFCGSPP